MEIDLSQSCPDFYGWPKCKLERLQNDPEWHENKLADCWTLEHATRILSMEHLEIVYNALSLELDRFLTSLHRIFKDTPAPLSRRFSGSNSAIHFLLKMCSHRWVENIPVCEQALSLLPHIDMFLSAIGSNQISQTRSSDVIRQSVKDPPSKAKRLFGKTYHTFLTLSNW